MKKHIIHGQTVFLTATLLLSPLFSCEEFVDIGTPKTKITTTAVYSSDVTAISAMSGIYSEMVYMNSFAGGGNGSITMLAGLSGDEFIGYPESWKTFETNSLTPLTSDVNQSIWAPGYQIIYYANAVIQGLANSSNVTQATKNQLEGEAKFIRALCHFYLINLFGDIPVVLSTDYRINNQLSRSSKIDVFPQIINDLSDAQRLLTNDYVTGDERVRPNKYVATSLLARVYLYNEDWLNAEIQATTVIEHSDVYSLVEIEDIFLKESKEAIWQLKPVEPGKNTNEGSVFDNLFVSFKPSVTDLFEDDDARTVWVAVISSGGSDFTIPFKYKAINEGEPLTEYSVVLRLAEQYLIRAEARARQGNFAGSQADLNMIRNRAGLNNTNAVDLGTILLAIEQERQIEFLAEWGHRWFDLKRWNKADFVLEQIKGASWQATDVLYPIPQSERENNPNLSQNDGY